MIVLVDHAGRRRSLKERMPVDRRTLSRSGSFHRALSRLSGNVVSCAGMLSLDMGHRVAVGPGIKRRGSDRVSGGREQAGFGGAAVAAKAFVRCLG